jgi:hypothetical protein
MAELSQVDLEAFSKIMDKAFKPIEEKVERIAQLTAEVKEMVAEATVECMIKAKKLKK